MLVRSLLKLLVVWKLGVWWGRHVAQRDLSASAPRVESPNRRRAGPTVALLTIVLGSAIAVLTITVGRDRLIVNDLPSNEGRGIAVLGPARDPEVAGVVVSVTTEVGKCGDPVWVTVSAAGTAEYWQRNRDSIPARRASFVVAVEDPTISHISVGASDWVSDPTVTPDVEQTRDVRIRKVERSKSATLLIVDVEGVRERWTPVLARFQTRWLQERSDHSCYVELPALTGPAAMSAFEPKRLLELANSVTGGASTSAVSPAEIVSRGATTLAYNTLVVRGGRRDPDDTQPAPTTTRSSSTVWECRERFPLPASQGGRVEPGEVQADGSFEVVPGLVFNAHTPSAMAFRQEAYDRGTFRAAGCDAVAAINESGAGAARDLDLLWLGAALGLGLALIAQGALAVLEALRDRDQRRRVS